MGRGVTPWTDWQKLVNNEEDTTSSSLPTPKKSVAALRVLGDHLYCDGLHFWVLLQAVFSPERRNRNILFKLKCWQQCTHCWRLLEQEYFLLDRDLHHVKLFWKVGFQNTKSAILVLQLICVYSAGRRPSLTHISRPLPDILYPPNGHCVLRALKQFILWNTQSIDHSWSVDLQFTIKILHNFIQSVIWEDGCKITFSSSQLFLKTPELNNNYSFAV